MSTPKPKHPGIRDIRWWTSPACARILERLECKGPAGSELMASELYIYKGYAYSLCRVVLLEARCIHICAWLHNSHGLTTPIYALGPSKNRRRPPAETTAQRCKRRRVALVARFGTEIAEKVLNPGNYDNAQVYIDGRRITSSSHTGGLAGTVTQ